MLERMQVFHDKGFLHRDLKPESIRVGDGKKSLVMYLTDFQDVKRYVCPNTGEHLKHVPNCSVFGQRRFLSLNASVGN
jgi:casein kinase 1